MQLSGNPGCVVKPGVSPRHSRYSRLTQCALSRNKSIKPGCRSAIPVNFAKETVAASAVAISRSKRPGARFIVRLTNGQGAKRTVRSRSFFLRCGDFMAQEFSAMAILLTRGRYFVGLQNNVVLELPLWRKNEERKRSRLLRNP